MGSAELPGPTLPGVEWGSPVVMSLAVLSADPAAGLDPTVWRIRLPNQV